MEGLEDYNLGNDDTGRLEAKTLYDQLAPKRTGILERGREMAELTNPYVLPPEGYMAGDDIPGNNQSLGSACVNSLASKLAFTAFPPGQPLARFEAIEYQIQAEVDKDPELWANTELALARLEIAHRKRLMTTTLQSVYERHLELLLVAGNGLWKHLQLRFPLSFNPNHYVVKRNGNGFPLYSILKETLPLDSLDKEHRTFIRDLDEYSKDVPKDQKREAWDETVEVYSVCKLKVADDGDMSWLYWEEAYGHVLPDTNVETDLDVPPMWPDWMVPEPGQDWSRSYCQNYRGDLYTMEAHASAVNDGASLAALSLLFVKPGATSIRQVREAKNLSTLPGDAADLSVFRTDKTADLNFVVNNVVNIAQRLSSAFLMQQSIQRSGERVTAEEIKRLGRDLDMAMGGLYTQIAQSVQRPKIMRALRLNEEENPDLPPLPTDLVEIQVVTGVDALGQSTEADNLRDWAMDGKAAYPETFEKRTNGVNYLTRQATARGIKPDGLIKTEDQMAADDDAEKKQAMMQTLMDKGTAPAVQGLVDASQQPSPTQTLQ